MRARDTDKLTDTARQLLEREAAALDADILTRLRTARQRAVAAAKPRQKPRLPHPWLLPAGGFAAASLVLSIVGVLWLNQPTVPVSAMENLDILAAVEGPEFYADVEFYQWLEGQISAG